MTGISKTVKKGVFDSPITGFIDSLNCPTNLLGRGVSERIIYPY